MRQATAWPRAAPEERPRCADHGVDAVNDQIGQARNHQFPCAGRPPRPATQGKLVKLFDGIQYPLTDTGSGSGIVSLDPYDNARKSSWAGLVHVMVMAAA